GLPRGAEVTLDESGEPIPIPGYPGLIQFERCDALGDPEFLIRIRTLIEIVERIDDPVHHSVHDERGEYEHPQTDEDASYQESPHWRIPRLSPGIFGRTCPVGRFFTRP